MRLKLAAMHWMRAEPLEETCSRLARCGYDSIVINGDPARYDAKEVKSLLDLYELGAWGGVTLMHYGRDLTHPDKFVRLATQTYLQETIRLVADIGGEVLVCVPSAIGKAKPLGSLAAEWGWCIEGLKQVGEYAGSCGVRVAIEALSRFETYFINTCDQALQLAAGVDLPNVGICLDTYHMNMEEDDPVAAIRTAGSSLFDFHVADSNRKPPGNGVIAWSEILGALEEGRYAGHLTAEVVYPRDRSPLAKTPEQADGQLEAEFYEGITAETVRFFRELAGGSQLGTTA